MIAENIENVIIEMTKKTKRGTLKWKPIEMIDDWEKVKKQIEKKDEIDLKDYFIDDTKSYCLNKSGGYVMLLNIRYGNAPVFSPALDRYILVVKINDALMPKNLSNYDCEGYKSLLDELVEEIECQRSEEYIMPDCLYDFLENVLGDDVNGSIIDE